MTRMKELNRLEYRQAVANLADLGFTVPAISYMTQKTDASVYALLKKMKRWKGRSILRREADGINQHALRYVERVFGDATTVALHLYSNNRAVMKTPPNGRG